MIPYVRDSHESRAFLYYKEKADLIKGKAEKSLDLAEDAVHHPVGGGGADARTGADALP